MRVRILPYNRHSKAARLLSQALGVPRLRLSRSRFRARDGDTLINWGHIGAAPHGGLPGTWWMGTVRWLNPPHRVIVARDKLATLNHLTMANVPVVEWTTCPETARGWAWDDNATVFVRTSLTGQGGSGIRVYNGREDYDRFIHANRAPLYTKKFNGKHEYRIHVFRRAASEAVHISKKRRRNGTDPAPVRNHANGYVYCTQNVTCPESVVDAARQAIRALGLDFGAVDILAKDSGECAVLEVNTAPGLEGRTLEWYVERFKEYIA